MTFECRSPGAKGTLRKAMMAEAINPELLRCIDAAIKYPVIYELNFSGKTQIMAAHKRPGETDANRFKVEINRQLRQLTNELEALCR